MGERGIIQVLFPCQSVLFICCLVVEGPAGNSVTAEQQHPASFTHTATPPAGTPRGAVGQRGQEQAVPDPVPVPGVRHESDDHDLVGGAHFRHVHDNFRGLSH